MLKAFLSDHTIISVRSGSASIDFFSTGTEAYSPALLHAGYFLLDARNCELWGFEWWFFSLNNFELFSGLE